jgi:hypothetical protein
MNKMMKNYEKMFPKPILFDFRITYLFYLSFCLSIYLSVFTMITICHLYPAFGKCFDGTLAKTYSS